MAKRKSICILALSPVAKDGRVLRQIEYLSPHYALTVVGYGPPHPAWANDPNVVWVQLPQPSLPVALRAALRQHNWAKIVSELGVQLGRIAFRLSLYIGRWLPSAYHVGYRLRWHFVSELKHALARHYDAYLANDWNTLLLAAHAARQQQARLVVDLHEYAPLEFENQPNWWLFEPMIRSMVQTYATQADATLTVAPAIAERYQREFGFAPLVVLSAPNHSSAPAKGFDPQKIQLAHHGVAMPFRQPDVMIRALALADERYTLHLMLMPSPYIQELKKLADEIAPGRVFFHDPVPPEKIVPTIAQYDVGFNFIAPTNYNYLVCLPNKFFESLNAGLAICTGPSPSMAEIVQKYQCGVVANSFEPQDLAAVLNQTTAEQWQAMQQGARTAAKELNAAQEMNKVVQLYQRLFAEQATG